MRISKKGDYALRALMHLGRKYGAGVVKMQTIADEEGIPRAFLEQILFFLKGARIVRSKSGVGGGYMLNTPPDRIVLGRIIRLIDGPLAPVGCVSKTAHVYCPRERTCGLRSIMMDVRNVTAEILDNITLADLCARMKGEGKRKKIVLEYSI